MEVTGEQLLLLTFGQQHLRLLGGSRGLRRRIIWFHALESCAEVQFLQPGELVFVTGVSMGGDEKKLLDLVTGIIIRHGAGLVVNIGRYIPAVPAAVIQYADDHALPLFVLPWEIKLGEVTRKIGELILEERSQAKELQGNLQALLLSRQPYSGPLLDEMSLWGGEKPPTDMQVLAGSLPDDPSKKDDGYSRFQQAVQDICAGMGNPCLMIREGTGWLLVVPAPVRTNGVLLEKLVHLQPCGAALLLLGIGGPAGISDPAALRRSCREARFSLRIARQEQRCVSYQEMSVYRLFDQLGNSDILRDYAQNVLGALLAYDQKNGSAFAETLAVYLEENEDTALTIQRLFIHRNTLAYRLRRIEKITHCRMDDAEARLNFRLAFKMRSFLRLMQND